MTKNYYKAACLSLGMLLFSCSSEDTMDEDQNPTATTNVSTSETTKTTTPKGTTPQPSASTTWDFNNFGTWEDATQVGVPNYFIDNGSLHLFTNANTWDRTKAKSAATYTSGTYSWRVYVPTMGVGDCASIGAFLYTDDTHELDFEIGYGNQAIRQELNAAADELIVYNTSQANPYHSFQSKIKRENWYTLTIELALNSKKKYVATWKIDDVVITSKTLTYGTQSKFKIFCSVENLSFIGDHIPTIQNYALFDWVTFSGN